MGATVTVASDPFEGTARFAEAPADLVVVSLEGWGRKDLRFLSAVRARGDAILVVALVPDDRRHLAGAALAAGAHAYLREPLDLVELQAVAGRVLAPKEGASRVDDPAGLPHLAAEVGHAVNNPLQVLSLLLEDSGGRPPTAEGGERDRDLRVEVGRIREAMAVLTAYARLSAPSPAPVDLAAALAETTSRLEASGLIQRVHARPMGSPATPDATPAPVRADPAQVGLALDALVRGLAARSSDRPARLRCTARGDGRSGQVRLRVRGLHLDAATFAAAARSVLGVDERTRAPHPGLGLADAIARAHGGSLSHRPTPRGSLLVWSIGRPR